MFNLLVYLYNTLDISTAINIFSTVANYSVQQFVNTASKSTAALFLDIKTWPVGFSIDTVAFIRSYIHIWLIYPLNWISALINGRYQNNFLNFLHSHIRRVGSLSIFKFAAIKGLLKPRLVNELVLWQSWLLRYS